MTTYEFGDADKLRLIARYFRAAADALDRGDKKLAVVMINQASVGMRELSDEVYDRMVTSSAKQRQRQP